MGNTRNDRRPPWKKASKNKARIKRRLQKQAEAETTAFASSCVNKVLQDDEVKNSLWNSELITMFQNSEQLSNDESNSIQESIRFDDCGNEHNSDTHLDSIVEMIPQDSDNLGIFSSEEVDCRESPVKNHFCNTKNVSDDESNRKLQDLGEFDVSGNERESEFLQESTVEFSRQNSGSLDTFQTENVDSEGSSETSNIFKDYHSQIHRITSYNKLLCLLSFIFGIVVSLFFCKSKSTSVSTDLSNKIKFYKAKMRRYKLKSRKFLSLLRKERLSRRTSRRSNCNSESKQRKRKMKCIGEFKDIPGKKNNVNNRIVDFSYMWEQMLLKLHFHQNTTEKNITSIFDHWALDREVNHPGGLITKFCFKCKICNQECLIHSNRESDDELPLNLKSILGVLVEGLGYEQVKGLLACMNIPYFTDKTFKSGQDFLLENIEEITLKKMEEANAKEAELAREAGDVDENGIPFITVIVDGSWLKRSYGTNYNSLSGCGAIIGSRTQKVLYVGIKNKFCQNCHLAEQRGQEPKNHKCCKNFLMKTPSTLMESFALVEGFQVSLQRHNIVYKYVVGDGDSSFFKRLLQQNPYKHLKIIPQKIECTNHLMRNLCKKLRDVSSNVNHGRNKGYITIRNKVRQSTLKIRQAILDEVDRVLADSMTKWDEKIKLLRDRIRWIIHHTFGDHRKCQQYGINCNVDAKTDLSIIIKIKYFGLMPKIENAIHPLSLNAESLLHKKTNNMAESFNNIITKECSGKRINYSLGSQYNTRVYIAVLQFNSQQAFMDIFQGMQKNVPCSLEKVIKRRQEKVAWNIADRAANGRKKNFPGKADAYYGPNCEQPDKSVDQMNDLKQMHYEKLDQYRLERQDIEEQTREQSKSAIWHNIRKLLLTASHFHEISRKKATTSCASIVRHILHTPFMGSDSTSYGLESEEKAREEMSKKLGKEIKINGLFIDEFEPMFGASPDGLIDEDGIFETKTTYRGKDMTPEEVMKNFKDLQFMDKVTNSMKKTHKFYYQIQGQLHVTRRNYCIFAFRTEKGILDITIKRDDEFWKTKMHPHLKSFYEDCLLPEILDSRYLRNMPIRDPDYILQAKADAAAKAMLKKKRIGDKLPGDVNEDYINGNLDDEEIAQFRQNLNTDFAFKVNGDVEENHASCDSMGADISIYETNDKPKSVITKRHNVMPNVIKNKKMRITSLMSRWKNNKLTNHVGKNLRQSSSLSHLSLPSHNDLSNDDVVYVHTKPMTDIEANHVRRSMEKAISLDYQLDNVAITNLLNPTKWIEDDVLNKFIGVLRKNNENIINENEKYDVHCTTYQRFPQLIYPVQTNRSIALIGGDGHWRILFYDGMSLHMYDPKRFGGLNPVELEYAKRRFPNTPVENVIVEKMNFFQEDSHNCGVYATAVATSIVLGQDPRTAIYTKDSKRIREHLLNVILTQTLAAFPSN